MSQRSFLAEMEEKRSYLFKGKAFLHFAYVPATWLR